MVAGSLTWFSAVISSRKLPGASWIRQKLMTTTPRISGTAWTSRRRRSFRAASWRELASAAAMPSHSSPARGRGRERGRCMILRPLTRPSPSLRSGMTGGLNSGAAICRTSSPPGSWDRWSGSAPWCWRRVIDSSSTSGRMRRFDRGDLLELDDQRLALGGIGLDLDLLDQGVDLVGMEARGVAEGHALLDAVGGEVLRGGRHRLRRIGLVGDREVEVVVGVDALDRGRPVGDGEVDADADILQPLLDDGADLAVLGEPAGRPAGSR